MLNLPIMGFQIGGTFTIGKKKIHMQFTNR